MHENKKLPKSACTPRSPIGVYAATILYYTPPLPDTLHRLDHIRYTSASLNYTPHYLLLYITATLYHTPPLSYTIHRSYLILYTASSLYTATILYSSPSLPYTIHRHYLILYITSTLYCTPPLPNTIHRCSLIHRRYLILYTAAALYFTSPHSYTIQNHYLIIMRTLAEQLVALFHSAREIGSEASNRAHPFSFYFLWINLKMKGSKDIFFVIFRLRIIIVN